MIIGYTRFKWIFFYVCVAFFFVNTSYACTDISTEEERRLARIALGIELQENNLLAPCISGHYLHDYRNVARSSLDYHAGVDIAVPEGTTAYSIVSGVVRHVDEHRGRLIITNHVDVDNEIVETVYLHLSEVSVKVGHQVFVGKAIGETGSRGLNNNNEWVDNAVGAHLHIEVRPVGRQSNSGLYGDSMLCPNNSCNTNPPTSDTIENVTIDPVRVFSQDLGCAEFYDVPLNHPYCDNIQLAIDSNIIDGYSNGSFGPNKLVNRAEFVKMVSRENNILLQETLEHRFDDLRNVPLNTWYVDYIYTAMDAGFIQGYGGTNSFSPERTINYAEALKISLEASGILNDPNLVEGQEWFTPYINVAANRNIDTLPPGEMINRSFAVNLLCQVSEANDNGGACHE